jgi:hypothetical protein
MTQLRRGARLQDLFEACSMVDLTQHEDALLWLDVSRFSTRGADARDFRAALFTRSLFDAGKLPFGRSNVIREESVDYLAARAWGTVLCNSGDWLWSMNLPMKPWTPSRRAFGAVLRGTIQHWNDLVALGPRFGRGSCYGSSFAESLPGFRYVVATCRFGYDPPREVDLPSIDNCPSSDLLAHVEADDAFWERLVEEGRRYHKTPTLKADNLAEVVRLCNEGSWIQAQWAFLRERAGDGAVEEALAQIAARQDWNKLLGVYIHALKDLDRAARIFREHDGDEVAWATEIVARHLAATDPEYAAAKLVQAAERFLVLKKPAVYRASVRHLREAREILARADLGQQWVQSIAGFRKRNDRSKKLLELLDAEGL